MVRDMEPPGGNPSEADFISPASAPEERLMMRRSVVLGVVLGTPFSAVFLWLALRGVGLERFWETVTSASMPWLVSVLGCFAGTYLAFSLRWARLFGALGRIRFGRTVGLVVAGAALSNTVPGRPGEIARAYAAARTSERPQLPESGASWIARVML